MEGHKRQRIRLDDFEIEVIQLIWASNTQRTARRVWEFFGTDRTSLRAVQLIIQRTRKTLANRPPFETKEWTPWRNDEESAEDTENLLQINQVCLLLYQRSLHIHEAGWGRKLRSLLREASPLLAFYFIRHYSEREAAAHLLGLPVHTEDIDGFLIYKVWDKENIPEYADAINLGMVDPPLLYPRLNLERVNDPEWLRAIPMATFGIPQELPRPQRGFEPPGGEEGLRRYYEMLKIYSNGQEQFYQLPNREEAENEG